MVRKIPGQNSTQIRQLIDDLKQGKIRPEDVAKTMSVLEEGDGYRLRHFHESVPGGIFIAGMNRDEVKSAVQVGLLLGPDQEDRSQAALCRGLKRLLSRGPNTG